MRQIQLSEETFRKLVKLKNHWSFQHRRVTNPEVLKIIDKLKREIFGYSSTASAEEIERISKQKSRDQLEAEMDRFSRALNKLLASGYDFEPEYTLDMHIKRMMDAIDQGEVGYSAF
jgi:predicted CopG family antitoxin